MSRARKCSFCDVLVPPENLPAFGQKSYSCAGSSLAFRRASIGTMTVSLEWQFRQTKVRRSKPVWPGWMCDRTICKPHVGQLSRLSKFFAPVRDAPWSVIVNRSGTAARQFKAVQKVPVFTRLILASASDLNLAFCGGGREPNFESARYPPGRPALIPDGLSFQQADLVLPLAS